jgi:membrane fusion protein, multidrug efflux system
LDREPGRARSLVDRLGTKSTGGRDSFQRLAFHLKSARPVLQPERNLRFPSSVALDPTRRRTTMTISPSTKHSGRATWLALAATVTAAAGAAGYLYFHDPAQAAVPQHAAAAPAMPVSVATVQERKVTEWAEFSGRLEAIDRVDVRSRVAGYIDAVHFTPGAMVAKGATLFVIDPKPFAAEVARAEASLAAAQARLALATSELRRAQVLLDDNAIATREFEERRNAERDAQAGVLAAQATLDVARLNLGYTRITAPIAGRIGRAEVTAGNLVAAGAAGPALTSIVSTSPIYASFEADEQTFLKLAALARAGDAPGAARMPVWLGLANEAGYPREGRIEFIDNKLDPRSGTIRVRAQFDNRDGALTPGLYARLKLAGAGERPAILIDDRAVGTDQSKKFVLVVGADRKVAYREVRLGPVIDGLRVVRDGLKAGESIVVNGVQRVRPGMAVLPSEVAMDVRQRSTAPVAQNTPGKTS